MIWLLFFAEVHAMYLRIAHLRFHFNKVGISTPLLLISSLRLPLLIVFLLLSGIDFYVLLTPSLLSQFQDCLSDLSTPINATDPSQQMGPPVALPNPASNVHDTSQDSCSDASSAVLIQELDNFKLLPADS